MHTGQLPQPIGHHRALGRWCTPCATDHFAQQAAYRVATIVATVTLEQIQATPKYGAILYCRSILIVRLLGTKPMR